ncbi:sensor c-di-GMP phosphodiesterase, contains CSS-motif sensor and EAL domain [Dokdonella immobilis]|uniref:cyclic-guanylate-specific phosphodiesterase n=1 Tax=Dokdonella immobilis TaxID=578942 RepID=A0A1I4XU43_9GAMM|nr:sensor c-di-GMP phosphodiesterase, contains CSS-motif sensor and EAL domain [Dokdonella immobilis]
MRKKLTTTIVLAVGIFGIALPVLAALYLAHRQSMDAEIRLANTMAGEILRRADAAGDQAIAAYTELSTPEDGDPCSDARLKRMRDVDLNLSYVEVVGYVDKDRLVCSSLGRHGEGIPLGPVEFVSSRGASVRTSVDLGLGTGEDGRFLILQKGSLAAALHPEMLIDTFQDRKDIAVGIFGRTGRMRLSSRGEFETKWMSRLGGATSANFFDGRHLVTLLRSSHYDTVAYVAVPADYLRSRLYGFFSVLVPIALVLGALLSFGIVRLARQRASLPAELKAALRRGEFEMYYQPIVELATRRIVGFEALMRWPRRDGPRLRPDLFIPAAEDCGLITQFTDYMLKRIAVDAPRLIERRPHCYVSVNLGSSDLHSEAILDQLRKLLATRGIRPQCIVVEATEHSFLDPLLARPIVAEIRALGIRVAIDDFGTGFSSLSHLTTLQTDFLKIDKVFVETVGTDSATSQVAPHIIRIAETLGLKVIGEGVENEAQAAFLRAHGVEFAQGWLFYQAMPIDEILKLAERPLDLAGATPAPA